MARGSLIDAKDTMGNWYKSSIIDVRKDEIKIHYQGKKDGGGTGQDGKGRGRTETDGD